MNEWTSCYRRIWPKCSLNCGSHAAYIIFVHLLILVLIPRMQITLATAFDEHLQINVAFDYWTVMTRLKKC